MNPLDTTERPNGSEATAPTDQRSSSALVPAQCDECGAPVEEEQRYCVSCGAHRRHLNDPAAQYLSRASARSRVSRAASTARRGPRPTSRARGLGVAVALALIPAAAAVGVLAGRSSNSQDAKLIQALAREQTAADRASASSSPSSTAAAAPSGARSSKAAAGAAHSSTRHSKKGHARRGAQHSSKTSSHSAHHKSVAPLSSAKPTAAQKAAGAKTTAKVQKSKGKSYVSGQSGLPSTVVVP